MASLSPQQSLDAPDIIVVIVLVIVIIVVVIVVIVVVVVVVPVFSVAVGLSEQSHASLRR
jgi:hypothetical protein